MGLRDFHQMLKSAQTMQEQMRKQMEEMRVEGSSGGGMVTVTIDGLKRIHSLVISPEVIRPDEREMLQDLVQAALNDAMNRVDEAMRSQIAGLASGLGLPGL